MYDERVYDLTGRDVTGCDYCEAVQMRDWETLDYGHLDCTCCEECDGYGVVVTGECRVAMSGPTCWNPDCPPCQTPETMPCPECQGATA